MKRLLALFGIAAVILFAGIFATHDDSAKAQNQPRGSNFGPMSFYYKILVDSTAATNIDSVGWSTTKWRYDDVANYGQLEGWFSIAYKAPFDTGTAGTKADTTKDSVYYELWQSDASGTPKSRIFQSKQSAFKVQASRTYVPFKISSDSSLGDYVLPRCVFFLNDSTHTKARLGAGITFEVQTKLRAKP